VPLWTPRAFGAEERAARPAGFSVA